MFEGARKGIMEDARLFFHKTEFKYLAEPSSVSYAKPKRFNSAEIAGTKFQQKKS